MSRNGKPGNGESPRKRRPSARRAPPSVESPLGSPASDHASTRGDRRLAAASRDAVPNADTSHEGQPVDAKSKKRATVRRTRSQSTPFDQPRATKRISTLRPPGVQVEDDVFEAVAEDDLSGPLSALRSFQREAQSSGETSRPGSLEAPMEGRPGAQDVEHAQRWLAKRELLSSRYYFRAWNRFGMRLRPSEIDDFGWDERYEERMRPFLEFVYRQYFRVRTEGVGNVPATGRALVVGNHGGLLPWDGVMLRMAVALEHANRRDMRWLIEDVVFHSPFVGTLANRLGAVRACQENAERLLERESLVAVFPEGIQGIGKLHRHRNELQRFGRGGYIKLALRTKTPIVPVAILGPPDAYPLLFKLGYLARPLGLPFLPVTPTFPWLGPLGLVPLPSRWAIRFGAPISLAEYSAKDAEDPVVITRLNETVRSSIQQMLDELVVQNARAAH